ncbi:MAG TPA: cyclic nucleotide-binding domain-containing protein [Anaerolineales bacterium]
MANSLSGIPLFEGFDSRQLEILQPLFEHYSCPSETVIFQQGGKADYLYLIIQGSALIQYKPYDGPPITLAKLKPGDAFGWSAVVGHPKYSSGIKSACSLEAVRISRANLVRLCREHPNTSSMILNRLANGVSGRWKDARVQVKTVLKACIQQ